MANVQIKIVLILTSGEFKLWFMAGWSDCLNHWSAVRVPFVDKILCQWPKISNGDLHWIDLLWHDNDLFLCDESTIGLQTECVLIRIVFSIETNDGYWMFPNVWMFVEFPTRWIMNRDDHYKYVRYLDPNDQ